MRVQHNIVAMNSYRNYNNNTKSINKNLEKLSSGYKINRAGDDAAGLAISEKMRAQITGLEVAQKNAKDGISLVQTAEGALTEVHSMLNRMFELAEQSANGTDSDNVEDEQLQKEVEKLNKEIDRIRDSSNFNGTKLLNGSLGGKTYAEESDYLSGFSVTGGGTFMSGDTLKMKHASDGTVSIEDLTVGGVALVSGGTPSTSAGVEIGDAVKSPDGTGTWVFQIKASDVDTTKAVSDVAKAIGDGMTITVTTKANPAADDDQEYELALDADSSLKLQIGDTADSFNQMEVSVGDISTSVLGSSSLKLSDIDISQQGSAQAAMDAIKEAINTVSDIRGSLGATQNRLEHTINNLSVMQENIQDAESTIRDTDVAAEMMKYTKNSILVQSAQAMLAQANQQPQGVLQLLQ